jgi:putative membrane protein
MMYWYNGVSGWGFALMALSMLLFWGLVIAAVVFVVRWLGTDRGRPTPPLGAPDPRLILAERFARGEIDEAEYRQRLKVLQER